MSERTDADKLAKRLLEEPNSDPDDNLRILSRQLLRRREVVDRLEKALVAQQDPTLGLIHANIETDLKMHQKAIQFIRRCIKDKRPDCIVAILDALSQFHPMHGESWCGWPADKSGDNDTLI